MKRQVPVLMITFQIPVHADVTVRQILDAIGEQLTDALETARRDANTELPESGAEEQQDEYRVPSSSVEVLEPFTEQTQTDALAMLGYSSPDPEKDG